MRNKVIKEHLHSGNYIDRRKIRKGVRIDVIRRVNTQYIPNYPPMYEHNRLPITNHIVI